MPAPQLWAILFFFMMLILGLGSQFAGVQMMATSVIDQWPHLRGKEFKVTAGLCLHIYLQRHSNLMKFISNAGVCMACFVAGLPMTCPGGVFLFTLMEWHTASWAILLIGMGQVVIFSWVYGMDKTFDLIFEMGMKLQRVLKYFWKSVWIVITPIGSIAIFIFILTDLGSTEFRGYVFPWWADTIGWLFGLSTLLPFFIMAIIALVKTKDRKSLLKPTENWGPQEVDGQRVDRVRLAI